MIQVLQSQNKLLRHQMDRFETVLEDNNKHNLIMQRIQIELKKENEALRDELSLMQTTMKMNMDSNSNEKQTNTPMSIRKSQLERSIYPKSSTPIIPFLET